MDELEYLRRENERLRKALDDKQRVASPSLINNSELIEDLARYAEGILSQQQVKKKWREIIDEKTWNDLGSDDVFCDAIEAAKIRRTRSGTTKREKAQQHVIQACDMLGKIALDPNASAKHRIDASKALDTFAGGSNETTPPADRFIIRIDLSGDSKLKDPNDILVIDATKTPAAITANKREDDSSGEPV